MKRIIVPVSTILLSVVFLITCTNPLQERIKDDLLEAAQLQAASIPPEAPTDLKAIAVSTSQIDLTWTDNSDNEAGFILQRKKNEGGYELVSDIAADSNGYADNELEPNTEYSYRLLAYNDFGNSVWTPDLICQTNESSISKPNAPSDLKATVQSQVQIDLNWSINSYEEDGFVLERKELGGSYATIAQIPSGTSSYQDTTLYSETTYYYRVAAKNSTVLSNWSNEIDATTEELETPTGINSKINNSDIITINWIDRSEFESGFEIQRKHASEDWTALAVLPENSQNYVNENLIGAQEYSYRVRAFDGGGTAQWSEITTSITPRFYIERLDEEIIPEFTYSFESSIVSRSASEIHIIYSDSINKKTIHAFGSGRNWTKNEVLDYYIDELNLSLNPQDQPCMLYAAGNQFHYSVFSGSTMQTETIDIAWYICNSDLVHDDAGNAHAAFICKDYDTDEYCIVYAKRNPYGQWTSPQVLYSGIDSSSYKPDRFENIRIDVADNGNIYISFRDEISEPRLCRYLLWDGSDWDLKDLPFADSSYDHDMCILENNLFFCYQTTTSSGLMLGYPSSSIMMATEIDDYYEHQVILVEGPDGKWHALYYHSDSSNYPDVIGSLRYVQQTGSSWYTNTRYIADENIGWNWIGHQGSLSLAIDDDNKAHFVYFDSEQGLCYGFDNS